MGSHISLGWFSSGSSILVEWGFGDVGFCGGTKTGETGEKPSEQSELTNDKSNLYMTPGRNRTQAHKWEASTFASRAIPAPNSPTEN